MKSETSSTDSEILRLRRLNTATENGKSVLYVMSRDQRVDNNFALFAAVKKAQELKLPIAVLFCLHSVSGRSREQYEFMLSGLKEVEATLNTLSIPFIFIVW